MNIPLAHSDGCAIHDGPGNSCTCEPLPIINMVLHCPTCGFQHVDAPESEIRGGDICIDWTNPPHKSHLCKACGTIWRPADVPTYGVQAIATRGKDDTWPTGPWKYHTDPAIETKAREIYGTWKDQDGWTPWVEGGNSNKQVEARRLAAKL